jgi:hypothetical protein
MTTKADVEDARNEAEIRRIRRIENLRAIDAWTAVITSKCLGIGGLIVGGAEMLVPNALPFVLPQPSWVAAIGLALLTGKNLVKIVAAAGDIVGGKK